MQFIFPSDYFDLKKVDAAYTTEFKLLQSRDFGTSVISLENLSLGSPKIFPIPDPDSIAIYRGWMITPNEYSLLVQAIENTGAKVLTSAGEYLATHYLPNWYPVLADLTPTTHFFDLNDDLESCLRSLGWQQFFIKDYVKSLKTSVGSIINDPAQISTVVAEMTKFRGTIEGGLCVRQVEDFIPATEERYFIIEGRAFAAFADAKIPEIVAECARRIDSKFFCVDIIQCRDGCQRVVEIGDGQVSGLVGWTTERFASLWGEYP